MSAANQQVQAGETVRINIAVGDRTVVGTLNDSAASRDLLGQLPVTLDMSDHGSVEKTGPLPAELSTEGVPASADPNPGDIGYYAPGNDFVLYYGDQGEYPGIVLLGRMDETGSQTLGSMDGDVTVTVSRSE
ncbi:MULTISPECIES: cyclophilin-like fold protein [unclassified Rhodococcus (in: high G+C Gram-positive bacteria)]|uniref:cyclophilin-like fold protein n=1 Tax=unclassified Rhodococcus (in: high G+C Gram-positive bacteria) TaxID=192944 RepID=UPI001EEDEA90|nr:MULTISPECIES: cyclophilin-like fold protein [unclassified Rhodococcus (in: high G+C Gram-positive bacteria)]